MTNFLPYLLATAVTTYLLRAIPLICIRKKITNPWINNFLFFMPYAVLSAMTFPAILYCTSSVISAFIGLIVALILAYKNQSLLNVAIFSCLAVLIVECFA